MALNENREFGPDILLSTSLLVDLYKNNFFRNAIAQNSRRDPSLFTDFLIVMQKLSFAMMSLQLAMMLLKMTSLEILAPKSFS